MPLEVQRMDTESSPGCYAVTNVILTTSQQEHLESSQLMAARRWERKSIIFYSLPWSEQLSTWLFIWTIFLGYHLVIKKDAELTIDAIHFKNHTAQLLLEILRDLLSLVMIVVFLIASIQFLQNSMKYPQKLSSMPVNMYVIYMVMPVSFALMAIQKFTNMAVRISNIVKPDSLENTADEGGLTK